MSKLPVLFLSSFKLSAFTFGGGYVIVPLVRKRFVEELNWIGENEMMDLIAIAQSAPGSLAVNIAILVGYKINGVKGMLISTLGTVLPPLLILSIISYFYLSFKQNVYINAALRAMSAGVAAIVVDVVLKMFNAVMQDSNKDSLYIMLIVFTLGYFLNMSILLLVLMVIVYGTLKYYWRKRT